MSGDYEIENEWSIINGMRRDAKLTTVEDGGSRETARLELASTVTAGGVPDNAEMRLFFKYEGEYKRCVCVSVCACVFLLLQHRPRARARVCVCLVFLKHRLRWPMPVRAVLARPALPRLILSNHFESFAPALPRVRASSDFWFPSRATGKLRFKVIENLALCQWSNLL